MHSLRPITDLLRLTTVSGLYMLPGTMSGTTGIMMTMMHTAIGMTVVITIIVIMIARMGVGGNSSPQIRSAVIPEVTLEKKPAAAGFFMIGV
jgi:hypothetical protein